MYAMELKSVLFICEIFAPTYPAKAPKAIYEKNLPADISAITPILFISFRSSESRYGRYMGVQVTRHTEPVASPSINPSASIFNSSLTPQKANFLPYGEIQVSRIFLAPRF